MSMRAQPAGSHYVDGRFIDGTPGRALISIHPGDGQDIASLNMATQSEIDLALDKAVAAQHAWATRPPVERGRVLRRAAELMRARNRELSELETLDTGKPIAETLVADAVSGADCLEYFGGLAAAITGDHTVLGDAAFAYTRREPLGVCVGIGAWNYPIQIACWKAAPALAAGNAMVFKPSELTPLSALALAQLLSEAGLPDGLFNVLQGDGEVGAALVADQRTAKVSVTGSVATGERVIRSAGIKPVTLELGGKSPLIVFADADIDSAVTAAMLANFYSSGQICSNGTRVFVARAIRAEFLDKLVRRTRALVIGDPLDPATEVGPLVSQRQRDRVLGFIAQGKAEGARLVCGGGTLDFNGGSFVEPTIFAEVQDAMSIAREEIFGPVMSVLDFDGGEDEVVARANAAPYGLAAGVFTRDLARAHRVVARLEAGTTWINTYNITPVEIPFGGVKRSGFGRENGRAAFDHYTRIKSVYVALEPVASPYRGAVS